MDIQSNFRSLDSLLREVSVTNLSYLVGVSRCDWLCEAGIPVTHNSLSELVLVEHGISFLSDENIRNEILYGLGFDSKVTREFNNLRIGDNSKTRLLINLLELSPDLLPEKPFRVSAVSQISSNRCLYPYQNWMRKEINHFLLKSTKKRAIVHMPTGSGKTRTSMEGIIDFARSLTNSKVSIVWLAHSQELCEQAYEQFTSLWEKHATEPANIVRLWGDNKLDEITVDRLTFVITSFSKAHNMVSSSRNDTFAKITEIKRNNALLVIDEAHQSTAETYQAAIEFLSNTKTKILGLTATPGRDYIEGDGDATKKLANFYENNKLSIVDDDGDAITNPIEFLQEKKVLAKLQRIELRTNIFVELTEQEKKSVERSIEIPDSVLERLSEDHQRTNIIIAQIMELAVGKGLQTIVFTPTKQNAIDLAVLLKLKGCSASAVVAESGDRTRSIADFKAGKIKVLTNYGVLTTGFDAPNIGAVVIARPTVSVVLYSQMLGRGLRGELMGGLQDCILVDVVDNIVNMPSANQAFTFFDEFY